MTPPRQELVDVKCAAEVCGDVPLRPHLDQEGGQQRERLPAVNLSSSSTSCAKKPMLMAITSRLSSTCTHASRRVMRSARIKYANTMVQLRLLPIPQWT
mmetsp:Transcript_21932/g.68428  ORF Transcript_21932/g.68428 Transcript_21932/m.68428 type:complete len:99 (+) Transcript_21932:225-521(+)